MKDKIIEVFFGLIFYNFIGAFYYVSVAELKGSGSLVSMLFCLPSLLMFFYLLNNYKKELKRKERLVLHLKEQIEELKQLAH